MQNRQQINDHLVTWIRHRIETKYPNDISLALLYGSYVSKTANERSDIDCYFIPETDRGYEMAADFILAGVGYDIFPMDWNRVTAIAELKEPLLPCVGDVQILYARSAEARSRFGQLQHTMRQNLASPAYIRRIIRSRWQTACQTALRLASQTKPSAIRKAAGQLLMMLAEIVVLSHHDYFHLGLKRQYEDLMTKFSDAPHGFAEGYASVIRTSDDGTRIKRCQSLLKQTAEYLQLDLPQAAAPAETATTAATPPDYGRLAELYEEICSTFGKIYTCCETGNDILAYLSAVCLQQELDDAVAFGGQACDLLGAYDHRSLNQLYDQAKRIEEACVAHITAGGAAIRSYASLEAFKKADL